MIVKDTVRLLLPEANSTRPRLSLLCFFWDAENAKKRRVRRVFIGFQKFFELFSLRSLRNLSVLCVAFFCIPSLFLLSCFHKKSNSKAIFRYNESTGIASLDPHSS